MKVYGISVEWDYCYDCFDVLGRVFLHSPSQEEIDGALKDWEKKFSNRKYPTTTVREFDLSEEELPPASRQVALLRSQIISKERVIEEQKTEKGKLEEELSKANKKIEELKEWIKGLEYDLNKYEF